MAGGRELEADALEDHLCAAKIAVVEEIHRTAQIDVGRHDRCGLGGTATRVTRGYSTQDRTECQDPDRPLHRHSGSAFPNALSFSCARCEIVSPGVPPASAC